MANTYTWSVEPNGLITTSELKGKTDVVTGVNYEVKATNGTHTVTAGGFAKLDLDENSGFTTFEKLTEAQVIDWVKQSDANLVSNLEKMLDKMLEKAANPQPTIKAKTAPWEENVA